MPAKLERRTAAPRPPGTARSVLVACSGNIVEWFRFFAYAFAAIHFAAVFFPSGDATS